LLDSLRQGQALDIRKAERGFRAAALRMGNLAFLSFLSGLPETTPACPHCGEAMRLAESRDKTLVTLMGAGPIARGYYRCGSCGRHHFPKDSVLGVERTAFSPGVRRAVTTLSSAGSFEWASEALADVAEIAVSAKECQRVAEGTGEKLSREFERRKNDLCQPPSSRSQPGEAAPKPDKTIPVLYIEADGTGVPMMKKEVGGRSGKQSDGSSKTREAKLGCVFTQTAAGEDGRPIRDPNSTSYFGAIETAEQFGGRAFANALERGIDQARRVVMLGDGARWIWNIADLHFPQATQIVDFYHAAEHVHALVKTFGPPPAAAEELAEDWVADLKAGDIENLVKKIEAYPAEGLADEKKSDIEREIGYFTDNKERMRYKKFKSEHIFVGSGVIEAGCKTVIGKRLKQSGMFWSLEGANSMIAVRCADLSCNMDIMGAA
jgi:hypothetical protein